MLDYRAQKKRSKQLEAEVVRLAAEVARLESDLAHVREAGFAALLMVNQRDERVMALQTEVNNLHRALSECNQDYSQRLQRNAKIRELAAAGLSVNKISWETFGYIGGVSARKIRRVLSETA